MEILETSAESFWRLSSVLGQLIIRLENNQITESNFSAAVGSLGQLQREAERLNLRLAVQQLERIKEALFGEDRISLADTKPLLMDLHMRILDLLKERVFLIVPPDCKELYNQPAPLFGPDVEAKFPEMSEDISEAGKCLALARPTAAVFHLMRVMEIGTQKLGDALGVQLSSQKNWQNILEEVNKAIKALDQKTAQTKAYAATSAHLYNVKLAWRNEVTRPSQPLAVATTLSTDLLDRLIFRNRVNPLLKKYFSFPETQIMLMVCHPVPTRGTLRIVMSVGCGERWPRRCAETRCSDADGKGVWS